MGISSQQFGKGRKDWSTYDWEVMIPNSLGPTFFFWRPCPSWSIHRLDWVKENKKCSEERHLLLLGWGAAYALPTIHDYIHIALAAAQSNKPDHDWTGVDGSCSLPCSLPATSLASITYQPTGPSGLLLLFILAHPSRRTRYSQSIPTTRRSLPHLWRL